jgi:hypothetical protein
MPVALEGQASFYATISVLPFVFECRIAELGLFRYWIGLLVLAMSAFFAGLWISFFHDQRTIHEEPPPLPMARRVVPEANRFLTTFQGTLRRKQDMREYWAVVEIRRITATSNAIYGFDYVLVMRDGTERGEGILSASDGSIQMGTLRGLAHALPDGSIEIGSRFSDPPPVWRFRSLPPKTETEGAR